jgi:serine O-acetyltransferase
MSTSAGIRTRADYKQYLAHDLAAHNVARWRLIFALKKPELYFQRLLRRVEFYESRTGVANRVVLLWSRYRLQRVSVRTGITFAPGVAGKGLSIAHYGSIVVNAKASIGEYCRIHSATNIGTAGGGVPTIGSFVYIGPGAVIYGAISVGDYAVIGANAVVNRDVPPGVTVVGAPARIISNADSSRIMPAWFPARKSESVDGRDGAHREAAN